MSIEDFTKHYQGVGICKVNESYRYNSINCNLADKEGVIIKIKSESRQRHKVYITIN